eukprot:403339023
MNKKEISMTTKKRLAKLFLYTGEGEQDLEFSRQNLCKSQMFEPYASFQRLDRNSKGYLSIRDFLNFMNFLQMLLPCDSPFLRAQASQRPTYPIGASDFLPFDVEKLLATLIFKELKLAREQERLKLALSTRYDYELRGLFKEVDDINYNYIDASNLRRFLIKCGQLPSDSCLISILRRFDLDADARLTLQEFSDGIKPQTLEASKKCHGEKYQSLAAAKITQQSFHQSQAKLIKRSKSRESANKSTAKKAKIQQTLTSANQSSQKRERSKSNQKSRTNLGMSALKQQSYESQSLAQRLDHAMSLDGSNIKYQRSQRIEDYNGSHLRLKNNQSPSDYRQSYAPDISSPSRLSLVQSTYKSPENLGAQEILRRQTSESQLRKSINTENQSTDVSLLYLFRDSFRDVIKFEQDIEVLKRQLSQKGDITLAGLFNLFTGQSQSRINAGDLLYGFERLSLSCDIADAKLIVARYDTDQDQKLGFWEFSNIFLPIQPLLRDELERRQAQWDISFDSKELVRRLLRLILESEIMMENIRQRIDRQVTVSVRKAFDSIDWLQRGFITGNEIKRGFDLVSLRYSQDHFSTLKGDSDEIECFIRRFNKDKLNGRISMTEFIDELTPKCPEKPY